MAERMKCEVCNQPIELSEEALRRCSEKFGDKSLEHFHADCYPALKK